MRIGATSQKPLNARAQQDDDRANTDGPVTEEDYIGVEYGHFEEYIDSTLGDEMKNESIERQVGEQRNTARCFCFRLSPRTATV